MNLYEQNSVYDAAGTPLNNKYNNKELQESGFYDYGWRQYMPDLGRWFGMDKLSEKFHSFSPYAYAVNNPVMFYDIDGRDLPDWLQKLWDKTTKESSWSSNGYGGFTGGEVKDPMSQAQYTSFFNFLMGGGTGNFRYWTGGSDSMTGYLDNGEAHISGDLGLMHEIKIKDNGFWDDVWNKTTDFMDSLFSSTTTNAAQIDMLPENPLFKFNTSTSSTNGNANIFNSDKKVTYNRSTRKTGGSADYQLNLGVINFNIEVSESSITLGGNLSAMGKVGFGPSVTLSGDVINSDISLNGSEKLMATA